MASTGSATSFFSRRVSPAVLSKLKAGGTGSAGATSRSSTGSQLTPETSEAQARCATVLYREQVKEGENGDMLTCFARSLGSYLEDEALSRTATPPLLPPPP